MGGLTELIAEGDAKANASQGIGLGMAAGVVGAGALAVLADAPRPANIVMIDLSGALGALTGAAIGSPLLIAQEQRPSRDRLWLTAVGAGTLTGGVVGYLFTQRGSSGNDAGTTFRWSAYAAPHFDLARPQSAPVMTTGIHGTW